MDMEFELNVLKKRNLKLIYILGRPGSGKNSQSLKIENEFKYKLIDEKVCIDDEILNETNIGVKIRNSLSLSNNISSELKLGLLVKNLLKHNSNIFIVDGFITSLDDALYFEKHFKEIQIILEFDVDEDEARRRILKKFKTLSDEDYSKLAQMFNQYNENVLPLLDFYKKYGIVRKINANSDIDEVKSNIKKSLLPEIYCIIGKRYSGKSSICNFLSSKFEICIINFNDFLNEMKSKKTGINDEFIILSLIERLRGIHEKRVIIEDFPLKKEHYNLFVKNGKNFKNVFYLDCDDFYCIQRMKNLGKNHKSYVGIAQLDDEIAEFDSKSDFLKLLKSKSNFVEIKANKIFELVCDQVISSIQPNIFLFSSNSEGEDFKNQLKWYFKTELNYELIDFQAISSEIVMRNTQIGLKINKFSNIGNEIPNELMIEMVREVVLNEQNNKFILVNYPHNSKQISEFEREICKIKKLIYVSENTLNSQIINTNDPIQIYFNRTNRVFYYNKLVFDKYLIDEIFDANKQIYIVYGLPKSGKKEINKFLVNNFSNFKLINFEELTKAIQKKLVKDDTNPDDIVVDFNTFINELKQEIDITPNYKKILLENLAFYIKDEATLTKFFQIIPLPKLFLNIICNEKTLIDRFRIANAKEEQLTDEEKEELIKTWEFPRLLQSKLIEVSRSTLNINNSSMKNRYFEIFLRNKFSIKFVIIKHNYSIDIENAMDFISFNLKSLVINVPQLIYQISQDETSEKWLKLKQTYSKKLLKTRDCLTQKEKVYYQFNPIHFSTKVVSEIIIEYIYSNYNLLDDNYSTVLLIGFLNNDLLKDEDIVYNLPLYEIKNILDFGNIPAFIQIDNKEVEIEEKETPIQYEIPVKPIEEKKIEYDEDGNEKQEEQEKVEEEEKNEDGTVKFIFKPENYAWTYTDGVYRNYIQHIRRLDRYRIQIYNSFENVESIDDQLNNCLNEVVSSIRSVYSQLESEVQSETVESKDIVKPNLQLEKRIILYLLPN